MLRRNPLAALSMQQPSTRTPSLKLSDDVPFELDEDNADLDSPDGKTALQRVVQLCLGKIGGGVNCACSSDAVC